MTMQRRLWSINALATELQMDRRTLARRLDGVPCDGKHNGQRRWYLATALKSMEERGTPKPAVCCGSPDRLNILKGFCRRLETWSGVHTRLKPTFSLQETARLLKVEPVTVLTWLRAGMPYVKAGDFKTGKGFKLSLIWVIEWSCACYLLTQYSGDDRSLRELRLDF